METRHPVVAGQFYPGTKAECIREIRECLGDESVPADLPENIAAGIVPHAGWVFSGSLAAMVFDSIKKVHEKVDTFIIFGAAHYHVGQAAIYDKGLWSTPMGTIEINEMLAEAIAKNVSGTICDRKAHAGEHSIEVQVPFIQYLFEGAKIVPIIVPPLLSAFDIGKGIGKLIKDSDKKIVCIGSTDLTHYGPRYGFNPQGSGRAGIEWARDINDKSFIDLAVELKGAELLKDATQKNNACGAGAAAAAIGAAKAQGKTKGKLLGHEHSDDIMRVKYNHSSQESVGYAAIIF
jgi:AmmeMemoRadiSam system protein B